MFILNLKLHRASFADNLEYNAIDLVRDRVDTIVVVLFRRLHGAGALKVHP